MPTTEASTATSGLSDVYFTPPGVVEALQAAGTDEIAAESPQPFDFVLGNPPFGAEQPASA